MMNYKVEGLEVLNPFGMPWIEFMLPLNVFQGLIIGMEDKLSSHQVVPPMLQFPHNGIELFVVSRVLPLGVIELLTKVSNGSCLLE